MIEIAAILAAAAFVVLVGCLVPVLIQARRTLAELETWLVSMNRELPELMSDLRTMSRHVNDMASQARGGVEHATALLHVAGRIGESIQHVRHIMKGSGSALIANVIGRMTRLYGARQKTLRLPG